MFLEPQYRSGFARAGLWGPLGLPGDALGPSGQVGPDLGQAFSPLAEAAGGGSGISAGKTGKELGCRQKSLVFAALCCPCSIRPSCPHPLAFCSCGSLSLCVFPCGPQTLPQPFTKAQPTPHYFTGRWGVQGKDYSTRKTGGCLLHVILKISPTIPGHFSLGVFLLGPSE